MRRVEPFGVLVTVLVAVGVAACGGGASQSASSRRIPAHKVATGSFGSAPQELSAGNSPAYHPTGKIIADDGFRPDHDGFSFPNYGGDAGAVDLTPAAMAELYGPGVCASGSGSSCLLTPVAERQREYLNSQSKGGHCYGFSVMALRFFKKIAQPSVFGAPTVPALNIQFNDALQTAIAEAFVSQGFDPVVAGRIVAPPNEILDRLEAALRANKELFTLDITNQEAGHAITPYAIEDKGGGHFALLTYDNNYPRITRAVMFDRTTNSWAYDASSNPHDPVYHFGGDAQHLTMAIDPLTAGLGQQPCPFCVPVNPTPPTPAPGPPSTPAAPVGQRYQEIGLEGDPSNHSHLVITDSKGHQTGFVNGRLVTGIPGSKAIVPYTDQNWRLHPEPTYRVPANVSVKVSVEGARLAKPVVENVSVVAPGAAAVVKGVRIGPGQRASIDFARDATSLRYHAGDLRGAAPVVELARETSGPDYFVSLKAPVLKNGATLSVKLNDAAKRVQISTPNAAPISGYGLRLMRFTKLGRQDFVHGGLKLAPSADAQLKFQNFDRSGEALPLSTSAGGRSSTQKLHG